MKKIKTMKLLKDGMIRFCVNNVKCNDDIAIHLLASEICERLTRKFKRIISPDDLSIHKSCVNDGDFKEFFDCTEPHLRTAQFDAYNDTITQIDYDPICGIIYIITKK
jgi:hypothetical protein